LKCIKFIEILLQKVLLEKKKSFTVYLLNSARTAFLVLAAAEQQDWPVRVRRPAATAC
jgi:hypothetical protein